VLRGSGGFMCGLPRVRRGLGGLVCALLDVGV